MRKLFAIILLVSTVSPSLAIDQNLLLKLLEAKRESYLSKRGEIYFDVTSLYSQDEAIVPWTVSKSLSFGMIPSLRVGVSNLAEFSLKLPYYWNYKKTYTSAWASQQNSGFGDPTVSLQYEVMLETIDRPSVYFNNSVTFPFGQGNYAGYTPSYLPLGGGHFAWDVGFSLLKSIDPAVLYGGVDYQLNMRRSDYDPADTLNYNAGIGFALNQKVSLSFGMNGSIVGEETQASGATTGSYNQSALSAGAVVYFDKDLYFNPSVTIGATRDYTDLTFTFSISRRLREAGYYGI